MRQLADDLGVSPTTVSRAYTELRHRALVEGKPRTRLKVADAERRLTRRITRPSPAGTLDLSSGYPDRDLLPDLARSLTVLAGEIEEPLNYGLDPLEPSLGQAFRTYAPHVDTDHVACTSGALDAIERVLSAWLYPGDPVAVEDPGYPDLFHLLRLMHLKAVPVRVDDQGLLPADLDRAIAGGVKGVVFTPRGQNPTGARFTSERTDELRTLLDGTDVGVIEDDHLGPLGRPTSTLTGSTTRWAYVWSVAKALGPDLRLALIAGDPATVSRVVTRQQAGPGWVSLSMQRLAAITLDQGHTKTLLERADIEYTRRRDHWINALAAEEIEAHGASGFNVWIPVVDETSTCVELADARVHVAAGRPYRINTTPAIRVTPVTASELGLTQVVEAIKRAERTDNRRTA